MSDAARPLCSLPPFAGARVCAAPGCGTILSAYNDDDLCATCRRKANDEPERSAAGVDLERLIAGLLLTHDALHRGEPVNLARELAALGVEVDSEQVQIAVRHVARRHGLIARGVRGRPGYALVDWERRYRPVAGFGGVVMDRDPASGRYAGTVALGVATAGEVGEGSGAQASLPGLEATGTER
jgi:hypothetical protein